MKIKSCYIENFGKLHRFSKNFSDDMDITVSYNGWGKTTFTLFLRAMLFGMESKRAKNSIREKYRPWQGGKYGGYIIFESDGKTYRAERYFNETESKDTFALYDCESGLISDDYSENLGREILHTDRETFGKTAYIPHGEVEVSFENDGKIISALEGRENSGDKDYDKARDAILKAQAYYEKRGGGKIADTEKEIFHLKDKLIESERFASRKAELEKELIRLRSDSEKIKKQISIENKKQGAAVISEEIRHFRHKIAQNISKLKCIPTKDDLKTLSELTDNFKTACRLTEDGNTLGEKNISDDEKEKIRELLKFKSGVHSVGYKPAAAITLIISVIFFAAAFIKGAYLPAVPGLCFLLASLFFLLNIPGRIKLNNIEKEADILSRAITGNGGNSDSLEKLLSSSDEKKTIYKNNADAAYNNLSEFAARFTDSDPCGAYGLICAMINEIESEKENITRNEKRLSELGVDADYSAEKIKHLEENMRTLEDEISNIQREIYTINADDTDSAFLSHEYEKEKLELNRLKEEFHILKETEISLTEAKEALKSKYSGKIRELFSRYTKMLSSPWEAALDSSLNITVISGGETHSFEDFSSGERDLFGLALRFSVLGAIYTSAKPPVILDDPLINLDEEKRARAISFLKVLSAEYQMIYFTCDSNRAPN